MNPLKKSHIMNGLKVTLPLLLAYCPVGMAFGILAVKAGMTPFTAGLMSLLVYAGAAQLIAVGLLADGTGLMGIVITTFIVNLRHALMSASLTPHLKNWPKVRQALFCYGLTDETYALNMSRFAEGPASQEEAFTINIFAQSIWVVSGIIGALLGDILGDISRFGFDFALPGMFIALLLPHFKIPRRIWAIGSAAILAVLFFLTGAGQWSVLLATIAAASIAAFVPEKEGERV